MRRRVFHSLLILLALGSCTRLPAPVPIAVSTVVPERLAPMRFSGSGLVLDAETRRPVAGVPVIWGRFATLGGHRTFHELGRLRTDAQGWFAYSGVGMQGDTSRVVLEVQTLQYTGRAQCAPGASQTVEILLRPRPSPWLQADNCQAAADAHHINPYATPDQFAYNAWFIDHRHAGGDSLRTLMLRSTPPPSTLIERGPLYLRLRLLAVDPVTHGPGEDLLTEQVVVYFPAPGRSLTFDLTPYRLAAPLGGFYVGLAPVLEGFGPSCPEVEHYRPTGTLLRAPCAFADTRSWTYVHGKGWQLTPRARNCWPLFESLIQLEADER